MSSNEYRSKFRSATQLSLDWLAKRLRRANSIKQQLDNDQYHVDAAQVAKSILNEEKH